MQCIGTNHQKMLQYLMATPEAPNPTEGAKAAFVLIVWEIWKERNFIVFNNKSCMPSMLI
jgi:hypothetical protein